MVASLIFNCRVAPHLKHAARRPVVEHVADETTVRQPEVAQKRQLVEDCWDDALELVAAKVEVLQVRPVVRRPEVDRASDTVAAQVQLRNVAEEGVETGVLQVAVEAQIGQRELDRQAVHMAERLQLHADGAVSYRRAPLFGRCNESER